VSFGTFRQGETVIEAEVVHGDDGAATEGNVNDEGSKGNTEGENLDNRKGKKITKG
jgi:hypothetical protein